MLAIEPIIDMGRTAVNVTGQSLAATVVAERARICDREVWDAAQESVFEGAAGEDSHRAHIDQEPVGASEENAVTDRADSSVRS